LWINSSVVPVILQKFFGNVIHCVDSSTAIFPIPISNNCFAKCSAEALCCSCTCILVFKVNFCMLCHKTDNLRHALSSSAGVECGITGRVCRKSPDNKISAPPKSYSFPLKPFSVRWSASNTFLWAIVHSPHIMSLHDWSTLSIPEFLLIFHVDVSVMCIFNVNVSAECAVWPPSKRVAAI